MKQLRSDRSEIMERLDEQRKVGVTFLKVVYNSFLLRML